jgi:hypothetical protein
MSLLASCYLWLIVCQASLDSVCDTLHLWHKYNMYSETYRVECGCDTLELKEWDILPGCGKPITRNGKGTAIDTNCLNYLKERCRWTK